MEGIKLSPGQCSLNIPRILLYILQDAVNKKPRGSILLSLTSASTLILFLTVAIYLQPKIYLHFPGITSRLSLQCMWTKNRVFMAGVEFQNFRPRANCTPAVNTGVQKFFLECTVLATFPHPNMFFLGL